MKLPDNLENNKKYSACRFDLQAECFPENELYHILCCYFKSIGTDFLKNRDKSIFVFLAELQSELKRNIFPFSRFLIKSF
jgi:hypothetical protein